MIAVSSALKSALVGIGVPAERITVLRNGVDSELFRPEDRAAARRELGLARPMHGSSSASAIWFRASAMTSRWRRLRAIEGLHVVFVGRGSERARLERLARERSMSGRVRFFDEMPQERLRLVYSAANVLVLASEREGWPNVLLESAACGTPVVAFNIGGVPEILTDRAVGTIVRGAHDAAPAGRCDLFALLDAAARPRDGARRGSSILVGARARRTAGALSARGTGGLGPLTDAASQEAAQGMSLLDPQHALALTVASRDRLSVLIYHRVPAEPDELLPGEPHAAEFERTMRWVKSTFNVIPLADGVAGIKTGKLPPRALSITFDDGYANNATVAAPILSRLGLHATFFIATGFLDGGRMFNDTVIEAVRGFRGDVLDLDGLGLGCSSDGESGRSTPAIDAILAGIKYRPESERGQLADDVAQAAGVVPPST